MAAVSQGRFAGASPARGAPPAETYPRVGTRRGADDLTRLLPPELAFLTGPGLSPEDILSAVSLAPLDAAPLDAALAEGIVSEERYYDALAAHLGCWRYAGEPGFAAGFDPVRSLRCGVAPLDGGRGGPRAVIAPDAESVPRLIEMALSGRLNPQDFAIASPHGLAALIRQRAGKAILDEALGRLPDALSARQGLSGRQRLAGIAAALAALAFGWFSLAAEAATLTLGLWMFFLAAIGLRSVAAVADNSEPQPPLLTDDELPLYTVIVAVYQEAGIVGDLVGALNALDYPELCSKLT